jgi:hypothetical protein
MRSRITLVKKYCESKFNAQQLLKTTYIAKNKLKTNKKFFQKNLSKIPYLLHRCNPHTSNTTSSNERHAFTPVKLNGISTIIQNKFNNYLLLREKTHSLM